LLIESPTHAPKTFGSFLPAVHARACQQTSTHRGKGGLVGLR